MLLRVNPEIAVEYDEKGIVTGVTARNDDAEVILSECSDLTGKNAREVVPLLVEAIGKAGYFTEIEGGEYRRITLEIEEDSGSPEEEDFFKEVIREVQDCVNRNNWKEPLNVENKSDYVIIDYDDDLDDKEDDLDDKEDDLDDDDADDPDDRDDDLDDDDDKEGDSDDHERDND